MPQPLSAMERSILDYLVEYVRDHTYQPSVREIGARFDIKSTKTVSEFLQALADKGWISRDSSRSRGVRLLGLDLGADVVSVPHIDVHLTEPSLDDPLDHLTLDRRIAPTAAAFMVSMMDGSMVGAGILEGDFLVVEPVGETEVQDGELALVRYAGEATVRRFRREDDGVVLEAAAPERTMERVQDRESLTLLGRVTAVIRRVVAEGRPPQEGRAGLKGKGRGAVAT